MGEKIEYRIDSEQRFITERCQGAIGLRDLRAFLEALFADPAYERHYDGLVDLRGALLELDYEEIRELLAFQRAHPRTSRGSWAFLAEKPLNFGVMRMFLSLGEGLGMEMEILETEREVRLWREKLFKERQG